MGKLIADLTRAWAVKRSPVGIKTLREAQLATRGATRRRERPLVATVVHCYQTEPAEKPSNGAAMTGPWFVGSTRPYWSGLYQVQTYNHLCDCCWIDAFWDGMDWRIRRSPYRPFSALLFMPQVRRWRGSTSAT